ncbi:hypothetical protein NDU88_004313 [Pleurodeles waltl]|uniref:Uncharacterized protein n=1 Tax=Pleurodeles waltl TaxID=8319 RepID=A0AAV7LHP8_PLEWA|nr:hypothetical protein NDU88_004313 [Pleurodeles waltl]
MKTQGRLRSETHMQITSDGRLEVVEDRAMEVWSPCSRVAKIPATYCANSRPEKCPGGPTGKDAEEAGNPDIRVPESLKRKDGQRARHAQTREDVEKKDAERPEESENEEDANETKTDTEEREPVNRGPLTSRDNPTEGQEGPRRQELRHVPGGAWLQQVRSCLRDRIRSVVGREEGGGGE